MVKQARSIAPSNVFIGVEVGSLTELKDALGVEAKLTKGSGGVFDVVVDGTLVYSKRETGRFPEPGEVLRAINGR